VYALPVALGGFIVFGRHTETNIIQNMEKNWLKTTTIILIIGHPMTALNIILNPVFQGIEKAFNAPVNLSVKRIFIRCGVLLLVLFIAQSLPNFGPILAFIGGSTVSLTSFILPCVFYFLLCLKDKYSK
jgi:vesicular inhibitory amino acid transporter